MKFGGCTWIMNFMHGRLHHLRMRAFMLTPFGSFIVVGSGSSVIVCVGEFEPFPYHYYPGIKVPCETLSHLSKPSHALSKPTQSPCDQCNSWLKQYYIDVPILQSRIQSLED
jgi:hypothetical protein